MRMLPPFSKKVVCLAMGLMLVGFVAAQSPEPAGKAVTEDESKWIVNDADVLVKINLRQLLSSALMKKVGTDTIKDAIKTNEKASELIEAAGIDVTKDIDTILLSGKMDGATKNPKDVKLQLVVRGTFDPAKVRTAMKKIADKGDGVKEVKEGTTTLYEIDGKEQKMYAAIVDKNTFVASATKEMTLEAFKGGKAAGMTKEMKTATGKFTGKESMTMTIVTNDDLRQQLKNVPNAGEYLAGIQTLTMAMTVTDGYGLKVEGGTSDEKAAKKLAAALDLVKALGKQGLAGNDDLKQLEDVVDKIKVAANKNNVTLSLDIAKETIEKLMKMGGGAN